MAEMAMPFSVWSSMESSLAGAGTTLHFDSVNIDGYATWGTFTGLETVEADGTRTSDPPQLSSAARGTFVVVDGCANACDGSVTGGHRAPLHDVCDKEGTNCHAPLHGAIECPTSDGHGQLSYSDPTCGTRVERPGDLIPPCTVSRNGNCVGRPSGYRPNERCLITVGGGGGTLGPCSVFDTSGIWWGDGLLLPGGDRRVGSNCPEGVTLAPGDTIIWASDDRYGQGTQGNQWGGSGPSDTNCDVKGTCGLPCVGCAGGGETGNSDELGGGWEICFV